VRASEPAPVGKPRFNLCDDPDITDGLRLVALISSQPIPSEKVQNLGWEHTQMDIIEFGQRPRLD